PSIHPSIPSMRITIHPSISVRSVCRPPSIHHTIHLSIIHTFMPRPAPRAPAAAHKSIPSTIHS
ncbi:PREDICTED: uncharacterized protein LOC106812333, partial [Priapulus caudatus]|uniref:Uncharacterized protein LOC106812333 n=1 Tax=Priapulus caudatus TaxID=37621 RepID=A0ABM1EHJ3_PRICU